MKNNECITIIAQAFYGNRTGTEIRKENVDRFILGSLDSSIETYKSIDRTVIPVPDTKNVVIVYNKYAEEERLEEKKRYWEEKNYELKPLVVIPEIGLEIYSRCIVCRQNFDGELDSLQEEDYEKFMKYLAY